MSIRAHGLINIKFGKSFTILCKVSCSGEEILDCLKKQSSAIHPNFIWVKFFNTSQWIPKFIWTSLIINKYEPKYPISENTNSEIYICPLEYFNIFLFLVKKGGIEIEPINLNSIDIGGSIF